MALGLYMAAVDSISWAQVLCAPASALLIAAVVLPISQTEQAPSTARSTYGSSA